MWCINLRSNEILVQYIEGNSIESMLGITANDTKDLKNLTVQQKNEILKQYDLTRGSAQKFYASRTETYTVLRPNNQKIMISGTSHIHNFEVLVCKFYHQCANQNFLKCFKYKGETVLEKKNTDILQNKSFIFIQNKIGGCLKCQSMIFTYQKNIQKQWVLASWT